MRCRHSTDLHCSWACLAQCVASSDHRTQSRFACRSPLSPLRRVFWNVVLILHFYSVPLPRPRQTPATHRHVNPRQPFPFHLMMRSIFHRSPSSPSTCRSLVLNWTTLYFIRSRTLTMPGAQKLGSQVLKQLKFSVRVYYTNTTHNTRSRHYTLSKYIIGRDI